MKQAGLVISAVCIAPLIAFAVVWTAVLGLLGGMWLWYSGMWVPAALVAVAGGYCVKRVRSRETQATL